jgi:hypothetical protein
LDLLLVKNKTPVAVELGEELEDGKRIRAVTEEFVGTEGNTVGGGGATKKESGFDSFADKAKVRAEVIAALRLHMCQECGYR